MHLLKIYAWIEGVLTIAEHEIESFEHGLLKLEGECFHKAKIYNELNELVRVVTSDADSETYA